MSRDYLDVYKDLVARMQTEYPELIEIIDDTEKKVEFIKNNPIFQTDPQYFVTEGVSTDTT